ncbi:hypothetical protein P168DRAFT_51558 [Aspergillus campestris IBT 28561]|uniref:Uncharacterized protein n=1 Tax=Aspergillus campestris (strain IBT 28561) TaxID=1392248 RepID=A0A2I1CV99_ASPC2|nr:uncharacterized protein P168DRAFT_51558 [Aspergillus campestris IBT 28561]PKY01546.1 hypothetical protein P168DRAFT_51558 [Aspergillus campestris IBT 28561]
MKRRKRGKRECCQATTFAGCGVHIHFLVLAHANSEVTKSAFPPFSASLSPHQCSFRWLERSLTLPRCWTRTRPDTLGPGSGESGAYDSAVDCCTAACNYLVLG